MKKIKQILAKIVDVIDYKLFYSLLGVAFGGMGVTFAYSFDAVDHGLENVNMWGDLTGSIAIGALVLVFVYLILVLIALIMGRVPVGIFLDDAYVAENIGLFKARYNFVIMVMGVFAVLAAHSYMIHNPDALKWTDEIYTALKVFPAILMLSASIDVVETLCQYAKNALNDGDNAADEEPDDESSVL